MGATFKAQSSEPSLDSWAPLYIFIGILATLFIATPFIACARKLKGDRLAKKATSKSAALKAEAASLLARHDQERAQARSLRQEMQVLEQSRQREVGALERSVREARAEVAALSGERAEVETSAQVAGRECQGMRTRMEELEGRVRTREGELKALQQKYSHVDQEYRRQLYETSRSDLALGE